MITRRNVLKSVGVAGFVIANPAAADIIFRMKAKGVRPGEPEEAFSPIVQVVGGESHTVGLRQNGTVVAAGSNERHQLEVGEWSNIRAIFANGYRTAGLRDDGRVVLTNVYPAVLGWENIVDFAIGDSHFVGLHPDGSVVALGSNVEGECDVDGWSDIKAINACGYGTVGLRNDGSVVAAGSNAVGQLNVTGWSNIKAIDASWTHTVGLREDGTVVAAGYCRAGECDVSGWRNIRAIAVGREFTVGLRNDGTVVATGDNSFGQVTGISQWSGIRHIATGRVHTVGIREDGVILATGSWILSPCEIPEDWQPPQSL